MSGGKTEDFATVLNNWFDDKTFAIHTVLPGIIESYQGHTTRKAKVKPAVKLRNRFNQIIQINPIDDVPVIFPSSSSFNLLFPIKKGDGCLLLFSEAAIGNFLQQTGGLKAVDSDDQNRFDLTDCIAIPGLWSFGTAPILPTVNNDDFFLVYENAKIQIQKTTNTVSINDNLEVLI